MASSPRRGGWFALGAFCGAAITALAVTVWVLAPTACSTVGYENAAPIELALPSGISDNAEVSACFDMNCALVAVKPDAEGVYAVPQEPPYLSGEETLPVDVTGVRVQVRDGGGIVVNNRFGIAAVSETSFWSRCPGPFHFAPVNASG